MKNTTELKQFDITKNEVRAYAAISKRGSKWTSPESVARLSGLSLGSAASALWNMKRDGIAEWKWKGHPGVFRLLRRGANARRAELDCEARELRLIAGPRMKPLFSGSPSPSMRNKIENG